MIQRIQPGRGAIPEPSICGVFTTCIFWFVGCGYEGVMGAFVCHGRTRAGYSIYPEAAGHECVRLKGSASHPWGKPSHCSMRLLQCMLKRGAELFFLYPLAGWVQGLGNGWVMDVATRPNLDAVPQLWRKQKNVWPALRRQRFRNAAGWTN